MGAPQEDDLAAWCEWDGARRPARTHVVGWVVAVRIRNASDAPLYRVRYAASQGGRGTASGFVSEIPPESTVELLIPFPSPPRSEWVSPTLTFFDASGVEWIRRGNGELVEESPLIGAFQPHAGAYTSVAEHPTLNLPHPLRLIGLAG
jgi:hypothetical protein